MALALLAFLAVRSAAAAPTPTPEEIKGVAADLVCLCGTCNRESLATCLCTEFAVPERESIGRLLAEGRTHDEIVARYVERFGAMVLASPPEGYDVVWIIPFVGLLAGIVGVRQVLVYWRRDGAPPAAPPTAPAAALRATPYALQLRRDLERFDEE